MPLLQKRMSATNVPVDNDPMKRIITYTFKDPRSKQTIKLNQNEKIL